MVKPSSWAPLIWSVLGVLLFLAGFYSGNVVSATVGATIAFAGVSAALTWYVASESRLKRIFEVATATGAIGIVVCGYLLTGSMLLAALTAIILCLMFVAFMLSYMLPKLRQKPA